MAKKAKIAAAESNFNPDDEAACFTEYSEKRGEIARVQQSIARLFSRYEKLGVSPRAIKAAYIMAHKADATEEHRSVTATMMRLGIIEVEADGQGSFMAGLNVSRPSPAMQKTLTLGRVRADGYNTGYAGGLVDACPHQPGTEEHVHWREQWTRGHADRLEAHPEKADIVQAAPRKRGRQKAEEAVTLN